MHDTVRHCAVTAIGIILNGIAVRFPLRYKCLVSGATVRDRFSVRPSYKSVTGSCRLIQRNIGTIDRIRLRILRMVGSAIQLIADFIIDNGPCCCEFFVTGTAFFNQTAV